MMRHTLLRNATATDGGGVATQQQVDGGNGAPSGTLTIGGDDDNSGGDNSNGGDGNENTDTPPEEVTESPIKEKIPVNKNKQKVTVKDKPTDLTGEIPDIDDLEAFPKNAKKEDDEEKQQEELKKKAEADKQQQQQNQNKQQPLARDYSMFPAEVAEVVKKAPNAVFEFIKKEYAAKKELETKLAEASKGIVKLPDSYAEHPQAYIFDPQYSKLRSGKSLAQRQAEHYLNQLAKIEAGEAWQDITGLDDNGNFTFQEYPEASIQEKEQIRLKVAELNNEARLYDQQIGNLKANHLTRHKSIVANIDNKLKEKCPWLKDQKMYTETKVPYYNDETKSFEEVSLKDIADKAKAELDKGGLGNNPLSPVIQQLQVALAIVNAKLAIHESKQQVTQQITKDKSAAEPILNGKGKGAVKVDSNKISDTSDMDE